MLTRGVLLMLVLAKTVRASFFIDLEVCHAPGRNLWKKETVNVRDNVAFIHNCQIYAGAAKVPFVLTQCIRNSEAHLAIPNSVRILRIDFLSEDIEWCTVQEKLVLKDGRSTQIVLDQYFECEQYAPRLEDDVRVYLSCDPHFAHPVIIVMLDRFRKTPLVYYLQAFFYGWCISIILSATIFLLINVLKPEVMVIQMKESEEKEAPNKNRLLGGKSLKAVLAAARTAAFSTFSKRQEYQDLDAPESPNCEENPAPQRERSRTKIHDLQGVMKNIKNGQRDIDGEGKAKGKSKSKNIGNDKIQKKSENKKLKPKEQ
ncbi:hypothetical protein RB195_002179 [Necator americanus]|uniref:Uncharacterized protein n=1 Tax=Necator americanus TaxID=51031 RepID=A0ABR1DKN7_NECAM